MTDIVRELGSPVIVGLAKAAFLEGWGLGHSQGKACGEAGYEQKDATCCPGQDLGEWEYSDILEWLRSLNPVQQVEEL